MLKSSSCGYSDAKILVKGTTTAAGTNAATRDKQLITTIFSPFTNWINKINNTQVDNAIYLDLVILMCMLLENSENYPESLGSFWQYYRDEPNDILIANDNK